MSVETSAPGVLAEPSRFEGLPEDISGLALFLDIDGTLLDLALAPEDVVVPSWMPAALAKVTKRTGGALALVTGRTISSADRLFAPQAFAIAGLHGADIRFADGGMHKTPRSSALDPLRRELSALTASNAGLVLEDKDAGLAIHYRLAPQFGEQVIARLNDFAATSEGRFEVQHGKMVAEVRPAGVSKGTAVATLMSHEPFRGRRPLAIGDDLTDETMFEQVRNSGGCAIRVGHGERPTFASGEVESPEIIRLWLQGIAF